MQIDKSIPDSQSSTVEVLKKRFNKSYVRIYGINFVDYNFDILNYIGNTVQYTDCSMLTMKGCVQEYFVI